MSSDAANSHPPRSPVNTGSSPALQCRGTQPGAGSHVNLPVTTHAAQGNGLLQHTKCVKRLHAKQLHKLNTIAFFFLLSSSCQLLDVPDGHRAPVPLQSSSSGSQSDATTTPLSSSSMSSSPSPPPADASTFPPNSEDAPLDMQQGLFPSLKV